MQPVVVRTVASGYELVVGERRWRAAKAAGLDSIPAVIRDLDDKTSAEWALVENLQREDLNPIERAEAFLGLQDDFGLTHQEIADQVGLTRSAVTNQIRLNDLDQGTRELVGLADLTAGHGRSLFVITNMESRVKLAREAMRSGWSVRELERRVRSPPPPRRRRPPSQSRPWMSRGISMRNWPGNSVLIWVHVCRSEPVAKKGPVSSSWTSTIWTSSMDS